MTRSCRVVVVDASPFVCRLVTSFVQSAPDLRVVGSASTAPEALALVRELKPDVVTLDLEMPEANGLEVLRAIVRDVPTSVILVTGVSRDAARVTREALSLGAVDFLLKFVPGADTDPEILRQELVAKIRSAVDRRNGAARPIAALPPPRKLAAGKILGPAQGVVVVGASTGGPLALRELLASLPADFPHAIVVVQHMPPHFTRVFAEQLDKQISLRVHEAQVGDVLLPGTVLVAPGDCHLLVAAGGRVELSHGPRIGGHRPSIDMAMQSAALVFGRHTTGVLLTGMGADGALGLAEIHQRRGRTFAQTSATCVVDSMPRQAREKGVVQRSGTPNDLAQWLLEM